MSTEENKDIVRRFLNEAINKGNLAIADELLVENYVQHSVLGVPQGREGFKQFFTVFGSAVSDSQYTFEDILAEGDKVVMRGHFTGRHTGTLQGIPPTGKTFTMSAIDIFRLANGKIVEHWDAVDQMGMLQQLGVIPT